MRYVLGTPHSRRRATAGLVEQNMATATLRDDRPDLTRALT
jgi:hypothetical protein